MRLVIILTLALTMTGCIQMVLWPWTTDWGGVWFGCHHGQVEVPAQRGMFGGVERSSHCEYPPKSTIKEYKSCLDMEPQSNEPVEVCMKRKGLAPIHDTDRIRRLHRDFAFCRGSKEMIDYEVDACMNSKGWD